MKSWWSLRRAYFRYFLFCGIFHRIMSIFCFHKSSKISWVSSAKSFVLFLFLEENLSMWMQIFKIIFALLAEFFRIFGAFLFTNKPWRRWVQIEGEVPGKAVYFLVFSLWGYYPTKFITGIIFLDNQRLHRKNWSDLCYLKKTCYVVTQFLSGV